MGSPAVAGSLAVADNPAAADSPVAVADSPAVADNLAAAGFAADRPAARVGFAVASPAAGAGFAAVDFAADPEPTRPAQETRPWPSLRYKPMREIAGSSIFCWSYISSFWSPYNAAPRR